MRAEFYSNARDSLRLFVAPPHSRQIAAALHLAEVTVKAHVGRILDKLDAPDRIHVVIWAYESGHLQPGE